MREAGGVGGIGMGREEGMEEGVQTRREAIGRTGRRRRGWESFAALKAKASPRCVLFSLTHSLAYSLTHSLAFSRSLSLSPPERDGVRNAVNALLEGGEGGEAGGSYRGERERRELGAFISGWVLKTKSMLDKKPVDPALEADSDGRLPGIERVAGGMFEVFVTDLRGFQQSRGIYGSLTMAKAAHDLEWLRMYREYRVGRYPMQA
eukprot:3812665-Rhodomonas_salina.1